MNQGNIGHLFFKEYYEYYLEKVYQKEFDEKKIADYFKKLNIKLFESSNVHNINDRKSVLDIYFSNDPEKYKNNTFLLKTTYPGLIIGTGYNHIISNLDNKKVNGEFKLGFEFDYTTGLPIINGSSVKGLLRSVFFNEKDTLKDEKRVYLQEIINEFKEKCEIKIDDLTEELYKQITDEIFEGKSGKNTILVNERDIFFEAVIDLNETRKILKDNKILGEDFITPHKNPKENPIPLKFIKVMPNVVWKFQFDLKDNYSINEKNDSRYILSSTAKRMIFERIILDLGIGAKTNVGYGSFEEV